MIDDKTLDKIKNDNIVDYPRPCIDEGLALSFHDFLYEKKDVINQLIQALRQEREDKKVLIDRLKQCELFNSDVFSNNKVIIEKLNGLITTLEKVE